MLDVMRCVLLCMLEAAEGRLCLLEVLEVLDVMRCMLCWRLEESGLTFRCFEISIVAVFSVTAFRLP